MPFLTDDGRPLDEILLAQRPADGYTFDLRAPIVYDDPVSGRRYRAPARQAGAAVPLSDDEGSADRGATDLASVPMALWSFIASYGRQSAAAILHDERSVEAASLGDRRAALAQRVEDDRVFRTALREQGVPRMRAWIMWSWVSADRERQYGGAVGLLLLAHSVVGALVVLAAIVLAIVAAPVWLALVAAPFVVAPLWRDRAALVAVLTASIAFGAPLIAAHLVPLGVFRLAEALVELVSGGDPAAVIRPTLAPAARSADEPRSGRG